MVLVDNKNFFRSNYRYVNEILNQYEQEILAQPIEVVTTKIGVSTVKVKIDGKSLFIHSKYDPLKEAERVVEQFEKDIDQYQHVFFYGIGFGYHIEAFLKKYPKLSFTLYEPNPSIFYHYLSQKKLTDLPLQKLKNIYLDVNCGILEKFLTNFAENLNDEKVLLCVLPSYEKVFQKQYREFLEQFKNKVQSRIMAFAAEVTYSKRWTLNSLMNLPKTLETPSIFSKKDFFKGKPVLLVSAGPSLQYEYENLKYIKENGLAYIFAVGSANRALIANDIYPDAVCTYDPQDHNHFVFAPIIEKGITSIPMIYGTSVGFETLQRYRGPLLHAITTQDTITPYYLGKENDFLEKLDDAFSIALVTLQLLAKLEVGKVILVGQNFAFLEDFFYSKDVAYNDPNEESIKVQEKHLENKLIVKDVYGNDILTNTSFNQMRLYMEMYIEAFSGLTVVNTTKGGAAIKGAPFMRLDEVVKELKEKVVKANWHEASTSIDNAVDLQVLKMKKASREFFLKVDNTFKVIEEMQGNYEKKNRKKLSKLFDKFDKEFKKVTLNDFYITFVRPLTRVQFEILQKKIDKIRFEQDELQKAKLVIDNFGNYLFHCLQVSKEIHLPLQIVQGIIEKKKASYKHYACNCGVFNYIGNWEKESYINEEICSFEKTCIKAFKKGSKINFKFSGTTLRLLGALREDFSDDITIKIGGLVEKISTKDISLKKDNIPEIQQVVFEITGLKNEEHFVEIELQNDELLVFEGVEIDLDARVYHVDEVNSVNELEIGKRIRCHYKASYNTVGEFSGLGEVTNDFIPPESSDFPDGDFYFIMVDEADGEKKLIADRNVQHSISWDTLNSRIKLKEYIIEVYHNKLYLSLLTGGKSYINSEGEESIIDFNKGAWPKENDWDLYIVNSNLGGKIKAGDNFVWNFLDLSTWCQETPITEIKFTHNTKSYRTIRGNRSVQSFGGNRSCLLENNQGYHGFRPICLISGS